MTALLEVADLKVDIPLATGVLHPVRGISFSVAPGETLCIVGESGCGKSLTALAIMDLLPKQAKRSATRLHFAGTDLMKLDHDGMADVRGDRMAMIFQEPMTSLNPAFTIGNQLVEALRRHRRVSHSEATARAVYLLEKVGITAAPHRLGQYPHQLSGGLRQRVMIAMALMCDPKLILADEPTTALDVTIQAQILHLLGALQREFQMAIILITHDLTIVARLANRVAVMYAGQIVEYGTVHDIFTRPMHPYTRGLLQCIPLLGKTKRGQRLGSIPGVVPNLIGDLSGCAFRNRCGHAFQDCSASNVAERETASGHTYRCLLRPEQLNATLQSAAAE